MSQHTGQHGMSLIEVMVAVLVLGIGVMGYAALQLRSVKMSEDTYARSQAMAIAQDAVERIRANMNALADYTGADWGAEAVAPANTCAYTNVQPSACTAAAVASIDIYQLKATAKSMLPSGSIAIASCEQLACVTVAWNQTVAFGDNGGNACDQVDVEENDRGDSAHCVVVDFIP